MALRAGGLTGLMNQPSAQVIDGSLKFNRDGSTRLEKTFSTSGSASQFTWSYWVKRTKFGLNQRTFSSASGNGSPGFIMRFNANEKLEARNYDGSNWSVQFVTTRVFRDIGWYHIVCAIDVSQSATTDRVKLYVNGERITAFDTTDYTPSQGAALNFNGAALSALGSQPGGGDLLDGEMTNFYAVDGQALGPENFGFTDPLTNTWRPKKYTGSFTSTRSEGATLNTSFATTPPTDSTGTTTLTTQNISTQTASTNSFGVTTSTLFSGTSHYSRVNTNLTIDISEPFTIDFIAKFVQSGSSSYFCQYGSGSAIIQTDNPAANTNCLLWGAHTFGLSYGWHSIRVQWDGSRSKLWVDGSLTLNITNAPGGSDGALSIGAHPSQNIRTFNGEFGPFRFTPAALGAPKSGGLVASDFTDATALDNPNSFYLPFDGNSPIGQDKSGKGNDFTPVNFSYSNFLDKATGALPILNTTPGGVSASVGVRTDANASSLALALPLASDLNAVTNQINSGASNRTILSHNSPVSSTSKSNFYGRSYYVDGTQAITIGVIGTDLQFGSDDFTMEIWFNANTTLDSSYWNPIVSFPWHGNTNENSQLWIGFAGSASSPYSAGELHSRIKTASGIVELPTGILTAYNDNAWHHVAVTRNGSTASIYVDGDLRSTASISGSLNTSYGSYEAFIGAYDHGGGGLNGFYKGYVSDFRVYKGVAKYTENFIPASTSPDILPDTPSGVSGGSKLAKITDGAVNFDGSGDYLDAGAVDTAFGSSSDWTLELFIYPRTVGLTAITDPRTGDSTNHPLIWIKSTGVLYYYAGGADRIVGTTVLATNKWHHVAAVRSGGTTTLYLDGKSEGSFSDSLDYASTTNFRIGQRYTSTAYNYNGFISNLRLVNGTALYTSAFTPPTRALTNVTNTKLLCCQSNTKPASAAVAPLISGINDGTQWSNYVTGDIDSSNPAHKAFDGSTSDIGCRTQTAGGATIVWQPPSPIAFSSSFKIYAARDGSSSQIIFTVRHAGGTTNFSESVTTSATPAAVDLAQVSGVTSPISSITIVSAGANPRFTAIEVDNTILVDPIAPNGDVSATNFNPFNTDIKTVLGQETGYATWNPLKMGTSDTSMSEGNLFWRTTSNGPDKCTYSTLGMDSGRWYWENEVVEATATAIGIANVYSNQDLGPANAHNWMYYSATGQVYLDGSASSYGAAFNTSGTIIGVAFDRDNLTLEFYKNGVSQGKLTKISGLIDTETYYAMCGDSGGASQSQVRVNFGQKPFKFPPPEGFQSLNTANLRPEKIITRPDKYFGAFTYTGTGNTSGREISGLNFKAKPDLIWIKNRGEDVDHILFDSVRGFGANKELTPNNNYTQGQTGSGAPNTQTWGFVKSNNIDGFTVQSGSSGQSVVNNNNIGYVSWCWKAGGDKNTFNIDDVGYANASDVGMNVGGQNSNEYDQSVTWSNGVASSAGDWPGGFNTACGPITNGFNGNTSNGVCATNPASIIWTNPQSTSTLSGKLEFYNRSDTTTYSRRIIITHAGGTTGRITLTPNSAWQDLGTYTGITSLIITGDNPGGGVIDAIRVGGKILVDQGITPPNVPSIANIGASVGTKQGFSIIQYQGGGNSVTTVAHGLSQKPQFMMIKNMDDNDTWTCYHYGIGNTKYLNFPETADYEQDGTMFNDTTPTSSVFTLGAAPGNDYHNRANRSGYDYIAYCWHDVPGLQKFGFYPGASVNGGVGDFIECGFRPALVMVKKYTPNGDGGVIFDTARAVFNPGRTQIRPNESSSESAEYDSFQFDFLANGFRAVGPSGQVNEYGDAFVFAAWAEAPAFNLYGGQSNAR